MEGEVVDHAPLFNAMKIHNRKHPKFQKQEH